ncbi:hypothetical protein SAMN05660293_00418 [Dyadobacter psychrophilus]|uniref:Uncharacterized protein n=1 Tax=Dyadobacter psychrophilus TaxID=651661 RepID=A0A1T5BK16_9BACT|nr:hypothetical protein SAMN05660293_00418 [Dyadobacter psychrophilus]
MREEDIHLFQQAAVHTKSWVLLRQTNVHSLQFIGRNDCTPKPMICKFKTANRNSNNRQIAGLVVSYEMHPNAFEKPESAEKQWIKYASKYFLTLRQMPLHKPSYGFGLDLDKASDRYGCITLDGKYLFGDYDLYDVIRRGDERRNMGVVIETDGGLSVNGIHHYKVMEYVNTAMGVDMIQHSNAALFERKFENVYVFSPSGGFEEWSAFKLREQYRIWKRRLIDTFGQEPLVKPPPVDPAGPSLKLVK